MKRISFTDWILDCFGKWNNTIRSIINILIIVLLVSYVIYFVKFGINFSETDIQSPKKIMIGLLLPIAAIIIFFIMHFAGGVDFNLRLIGLPVGLAIGGTSIGLIAGWIRGFNGWLIGCFTGTIIIILTIRFYFKHKREDKGVAP